MRPPQLAGPTDRHFSSFVGFAPAPAPRIAVGVFLDEPRGEVYGGEVAAPVFREVVEFAMKSLGVAPSEAGGPEAAAPAPSAPRAPEPEEARALEAAPPRPPRPGTVAVPALDGLSARAAIRALEAVDLLGEVSGSGRVADQSPPPGAVVGRGARVRLTLAPP